MATENNYIQEKQEPHLKNGSLPATVISIGIPAIIGILSFFLRSRRLAKTFSKDYFRRIDKIRAGKNGRLENHLVFLTRCTFEGNRISFFPTKGHGLFSCQHLADQPGGLQSAHPSPD